MPTVSLSLTDTNQDGVGSAGAPTVFTANDLRAGTSLGDTYAAGWRFQGLTIPAGATIISAAFTPGFQSSPTGTAWGSVKAVNAVNHAAWAASNNPYAVSKIATGAQPLVKAQTTYDMTAAVQAVVNLSGWGSGNAISFAVDPTGNNGAFLFNGMDTITKFTATLVVEYEVPVDVTPPTVTSSAALTVAEGTTLAHALTANETVTWTKVGGADAASFTLTGSTLSLSAQTYPSGPFVVVVRATDAADNWTEQTITVTVTAAPPISFIGAATGTTTATMPAHQAGDLILCWAYRDGSNTLPTLASAGWTSLNGVTGANTNSARLVGKIAASSSEAVGTFTSATSVVVAAYRPKAGYTLSFGAVAATTGASTTVSYPDLTLQTTDGSSWVAGFSGHRSVNTSLETPPSGMVNRATVLDTTDEAAAHDTNGGVAAWTARSVSVAGTSSGWRSATVEIKVTYTSPTSPRKAPRYSSWL